MKVLGRGHDGKGMIYLDPIRLPEIIANSARGFANGVLSGEHLIASTIGCSSHHESTDAAGIHLRDIDWKDPVPGEGDIRLQMDAGTVEAEFWYDDDDAGIESGVCPLSVEQLGRVADYIASHAKVRLAYLGAPAPTVQVTMLYDSMRYWFFREGEIHATEHAPMPGGMTP